MKIVHFFICLCTAWSTRAEWLNHNSYNYYFGTGSADVYNTWHSARAWCMQNGGDLTSIGDQAEDNYIKSNVPNATSFWMGYNALADRNTWVWSNKHSGSYENWKTGYPTDPSASGNFHLCGEFEVTAEPKNWKNSHCDNPRGFICRRNQGSTGPVTDSPTPSVGGFCPQGYFNFDTNSNKCYRMVFHDNKDGKTWQEARDLCRSGGGRLPDLVSIHSQYETSVLASQLQSYSHGLWIGLRSSEAAWRWNDNTALEYKNWGPGEPNGYGEDCAEMWIVPGPIGTWNNMRCDDKRGYICQAFKDSGNTVPTPASTTQNNCPAGFMPYWYGCYKVVETLLTWQKAQEECRKTSGAELASIHSPTENSAIFISVSKQGGMWIGLNDVANTGEYKWTDGWAVLSTEWGVNEPSEQEGGGCVAIHTDGKWYNKICNTQMKSLCKYTTATPITPPSIPDGFCPGEAEGTTSNWVKFNGHCYILGNSPFRNWRDSVNECKKRGGPLANLASIHSIIENRFVKDLVSKEYYGAWIGLYRSRSDFAFHWQDYSAIQYINWAMGEPNGNATSEDCVEIYSSGNLAGFWNDHRCQDTKSFVCKAPQVSAPPEPSNIPGTCPEGWEAYGSHCYYFEPNTFSSWSMSEAFCKEKHVKSNLASIHNFYENEWIRERMVAKTQLPENHEYWIGLSKKGPLDDGHEFQWVDGTELDLTFWAPDEPNDHESNEHCVQVYPHSGLWNDFACEGVYHGYVCKMNKEGTGSGLSSGQVAGIVIGVILGVLVLVGIAMFFADRRGVVNVRRSAAAAKENLQGFGNKNYDNMSTPASTQGQQTPSNDFSSA